MVCCLQRSLWYLKVTGCAREKAGGSLSRLSAEGTGGKEVFSLTAREACSEVAGSAPEPPLVDFSVCSSRLLCPAWVSATRNVC